MNEQELATGIMLGSLVVLFFIGLSVLLLVIVHSRRLRHRAELAEAEHHREQEVMRAEREAVQHTLREVGRELHDNVGQLLTVVQMGLNTAMDTHALAAPLLGTARDALDQGIEEVRRLGHSLNSDLWEDRSFVDAISAEAERIERVGRIAAHVLVEGVVPMLPADTSTILFRIFQETVTNTMKHSGADTLDITLTGGPHFRLRVCDNGHGFDTAQVIHHGGLVNIPKRCALIGFDADLVSTPGAGCCWTFTQRQANGT